MTQEEIIQAISDDKTMPFIQPEQLAGIVDFVIKNYNSFLDTLPKQPVKPLTIEDVVEQGKRFGRKVEIINHDEVTLQEPEVPKEICPRCIHYGEYCYQPGGGMQYKINENGVYDCTHFNEKEQSASVDLEEEISRTYHDGSVADTDDMDHNDYENIARHFAEWGRNNLK